MRNQTIAWIVFGLIVLAILLSVLRPSNPPYVIEIRSISEDGTVTYEAQNYHDWNHRANIRGLRQHTRDIIFQSVYYHGLQYCFSDSGRVYAMVGNQNNLPSFLDRQWDWLGDPHEFPHYDYSHESSMVTP
jgi:hypothetical protein